MPKTVEFSHLAGFNGGGEVVMRGGAGASAGQLTLRAAPVGDRLAR